MISTKFDPIDGSASKFLTENLISYTKCNNFHYYNYFYKKNLIILYTNTSKSLKHNYRTRRKQIKMTTATLHRLLKLVKTSTHFHTRIKATSNNKKKHKIRTFPVTLGENYRFFSALSEASNLLRARKFARFVRTPGLYSSPFFPIPGPTFPSFPLWGTKRWDRS